MTEENTVYYADGLAHVMRTPRGIDIFVPSGVPACKNVKVVVNNNYSALVDLLPGVITLERNQLANALGEIMPSAELVIGVTLIYPEGLGHDHYFKW